MQRRACPRVRRVLDGLDVIWVEYQIIASPIRGDLDDQDAVSWVNELHQVVAGLDGCVAASPQPLGVQYAPRPQAFQFGKECPVFVHRSVIQ
jgi:hypothetical protein